MVLDGLYDERLYLSTAMLSRTKVGDMSIFCFQSNVRVSMGLTDRRKTATNLADSRKN